MPEFIPDPVKPTYIYVGAVLVDLLGGEYTVEAVTAEYWDARCTKPALNIPAILRTDGVHRYRWEERIALRPKVSR